MTIFLSIATWFYSNWKWLGYPLAVVLLLLWRGASADLYRCEGALSKASTEQTEASGTGESAITIPAHGNCPEVRIVTKTNTVTKQVPVMVQGPGPKGGLGVWLGAGYVEKMGPVGSVRVSYDKVALDGLVGFGGYGGTVSYKLVEF